MVEGGAPLPRAVARSGGDRGLEVAGDSEPPQGIPVDAALDAPPPFHGQCDGTGGVLTAGWALTRSQARSLAQSHHRWRSPGLGMGRRQFGQEVKGVLPGGLRLGGLPAILRGVPGLISSRQIFPGHEDRVATSTIAPLRIVSPRRPDIGQGAGETGRPPAGRATGVRAPPARSEARGPVRAGTMLTSPPAAMR